MPLAIVLAARYIKKRNGRITVKQYTRQYYQDKKKRKLLTTKGIAYPFETETAMSTITTYSISIDYLRVHQQSAVKLLSLMSFFDRQGIQESLIRARAKPG
jgi:hypothetical protein